MFRPRNTNYIYLECFFAKGGVSECPNTKEIVCPYCYCHEHDWWTKKLRLPCGCCSYMLTWFNITRYVERRIPMVLRNGKRVTKLKNETYHVPIPKYWKQHHYQSLIDDYTGYSSLIQFVHPKQRHLFDPNIASLIYSFLY